MIVIVGMIITLSGVMVVRCVACRVRMKNSRRQQSRNEHGTTQQQHQQFATGVSHQDLRIEPIPGIKARESESSGEFLNRETASEVTVRSTSDGQDLRHFFIQRWPERKPEIATKAIFHHVRVGNCPEPALSKVPDFEGSLQLDVESLILHFWISRWLAKAEAFAELLTLSGHSAPGDFRWRMHAAAVCGVRKQQLIQRRNWFQREAAFASQSTATFLSGAEQCLLSFRPDALNDARLHEFRDCSDDGHGH